MVGVEKEAVRWEADCVFHVASWLSVLVAPVRGGHRRLLPARVALLSEHVLCLRFALQDDPGR